MVMRRLTAGDIAAVVFDSDFGISDGNSSRQEDGEDIYDRDNAAIERQRLRKETRCLTVEKTNASGVMLQMLQDIKEDLEVAADIPASDVDNGLSCSSHNCYFRE